MNIYGGLAAGSLLIFIATMFSIYNLTNFEIRSFDEAWSVPFKAWRLINSNSTERYWLLGATISAICSIIGSVYTIKKLSNIISPATIKSEATLIKAWIVLLSFNTAIALYYSLYLALLILFGALAAAMLLSLASSSTKRGYGPVYVRSYSKRNGSHVSSHWRKRPRG